MVRQLQNRFNIFRGRHYMQKFWDFGIRHQSIYRGRSTVTAIFCAVDTKHENRVIFSIQIYQILLDNASTIGVELTYSLRGDLFYEKSFILHK